MGRTPDRRPGALEEDEELRFTSPAGSSPSVNGAVTYDPTLGEFRMRDAIGIFNPRDTGGGGGISADDHKTLLQLIHFIDEGPADGFASGATKTVTGTTFPTQVLWRRADATKLVQQDVTWTGVLPTTVTWRVYGTDGTTVLATVTDTITYSGVYEASRTRSIS